MYSRHKEFIRKSCEWKDQLISKQSLLYIMNAYWQNLKTSALRDAVLVNFNWICWASKERRDEKLNSQLDKGRLPQVHSSAWFPTLDVILRERKPKKRHYKTSIFENLEDAWSYVSVKSKLKLPPGQPPGAFELLENFCSNCPLPRPKSCSS